MSTGRPVRATFSLMIDDDVVEKMNYVHVASASLTGMFESPIESPMIECNGPCLLFCRMAERASRFCRICKGPMKEKFIRGLTVE